MRSRSLLWSFNYAIQGIVYSLRTQRNMRLHVGAAGLVLSAAVLLDVSRLEMVALLFAIGFVLFTELVNTAIESTVDLTVERFDPRAKIAKDIAAGGVLISSLTAVAVGYVIFFDRARDIATEGFVLVSRSPVHLTVIALGLTALAVIALKASSREGGTFLRGGWPSGHVALATAAAAAVGYATRNSSAAVLALFIAALVMQSRIESGAHTIPQAVSGALVGFLITTLVFQVLSH
ncbi:MAG TPA: diacylglycerol kinase [Coriobacteriia bacterium]|nr:diacylglycerol kinase [Coriobacteriia bacterium]